MKNLIFAVFLGISSLFLESRPVHIFMIGDSTMANKSDSVYPETGWGQMLPKFFSNQVIIDNHAQNGRSSKSFIEEGRWQKILDSLQSGDYVIIQFGHNDEKTNTPRGTFPRTTFRDNLIKYIKESQARGAHPILCTSIVRRKFNEQGKLEDTHGEYITVVRDLAREMNIPLLDLEQKTSHLLSELGPEKSKELFVYVEPGTNRHFPKGRKDDTHLNVNGAIQIAGLAVEAMKEQKMDLIQYLKK